MTSFFVPIFCYTIVVNYKLLSVTWYGSLFKMEILNACNTCCVKHRQYLVPVKYLNMYEFV